MRFVFIHLTRFSVTYGLCVMANRFFIIVQKDRDVNTFRWRKRDESLIHLSGFTVIWKLTQRFVTLQAKSSECFLGILCDRTKPDCDCKWKEISFGFIYFFQSFQPRCLFSHKYSAWLARQFKWSFMSWWVCICSLSAFTGWLKDWSIKKYLKLLLWPARAGPWSSWGYLFFSLINLQRLQNKYQIIDIWNLVTNWMSSYFVLRGIIQIWNIVLRYFFDKKSNENNNWISFLLLYKYILHYINLSYLSPPKNEFWGFKVTMLRSMNTFATAHRLYHIVKFDTDAKISQPCNSFSAWLQIVYK